MILQASASFAAHFRCPLSFFDTPPPCERDAERWSGHFFLLGLMPVVMLTHDATQYTLLISAKNANTLTDIWPRLTEAIGKTWSKFDIPFGPKPLPQLILPRKESVNANSTNEAIRTFRHLWALGKSLEELEIHWNGNRCKTARFSRPARLLEERLALSRASGGTPLEAAR